MQNTNYHRLLRISSLVIALVLLFESGLVHKSTKQLSVNAHMYLANAVGMTASVNPTELNLITADLAIREKDLAGREAALREREIAINLVSGEEGEDYAVFILSSILFILLVLILLNYILDYLRVKEKRMTQTV